MQELSRGGFELRSSLIGEQAEGGDTLARSAHEDPRFLEGFSRVCEGAGSRQRPSEIDAEGRDVRPAAQVDLPRGKLLAHRKHADPTLVAQLAADAPRAGVEPDAAKNDGRCRGPASDEGI